MELWGHFGATAKHSRNPHFFQRHSFAEGFQKFRRREKTTNVRVSLQERKALLDYVLFVAFCFFCFALFDQFDDPTRIEIHHEADAASELRQMLDRETQPAWPGWSQR